ncbi:hypothetical protein DFP72DRAFT_824928 [Ephemerocybe angulata]|uniref:Uncharacterized protein n=1 Tax=Ephemerocybe angulata TaxID=980116 RepID=A0A8H6LWQ8_9AGAR|nr:hypothetical protein DFP72DRAFT_824928 [Tulosesus angulatus]
MQLTTEIQHDEINLFRLVRRLEKSIQNTDDWDDAQGSTRAKAHKELQKVKYARKLVKNVEAYERQTGSRQVEHMRRLNSVKSALDKIESVLKDTESKHTQSPGKGPSLLEQLPPPIEPVTPSESLNGEDDELDGQTTPKAQSQRLPSPLDIPPTDNFLLSPAEELPLGLPSSGLVSALPALVSAAPFDGPLPYRSVPPASTTTTARETSSDLGLHNRKPQGAAASFESHNAVQTELSQQLEQMAAQLKRNALHFASALEKDRAVVEAAQGKVEGNLTFMETQRGRLKAFAGKSGGTTWITLGIVLCVLLLFILMVGFIRMTRF